MNYMVTPIVDTPSTVGEDYDGVRVLAGTEGVGSFGPYQSLLPGRWFAGFNVRLLEAPTIDRALKIDVCHDQGREVLGEAWFGADDFCLSTPGLLGVTFQVKQPVTDYELRLYFAGSGKFEVLDKLVFRADLV